MHGAIPRRLKLVESPAKKNSRASKTTSIGPQVSEQGDAIVPPAALQHACRDTQTCTRSGTAGDSHSRGHRLKAKGDKASQEGNAPPLKQPTDWGFG